MVGLELEEEEEGWLRQKSARPPKNFPLRSSFALHAKGYEATVANLRGGRGRGGAEGKD